MIVSYYIMYRFYKSKGEVLKSEKYLNKYYYYLNELKKMIFVPLNKKGDYYLALPYASQPNVDTGHGWRTPQGKRTGSLSASCYYIFAVKKFNPISFEGNEKFYKVKLKK